MIQFTEHTVWGINNYIQKRTNNINYRINK